MKQAEIDSLAQVQREEFRKAYDALLKDKNALVISLQSLELENEKLKCTISELENQLRSGYERAEGTHQQGQGQRHDGLHVRKERKQAAVGLPEPLEDQYSKNEETLDRKIDLRSRCKGSGSEIRNKLESKAY